MMASRGRVLSEGVEVPFLGFGTYLIPNVETADAVARAIDTGYRHIDTAEAYRNETGVGEGVRRGLEKNNLRREDIFLTTKLWPKTAEGAYKSKGQTLAAFEESLHHLGVDHVDLYLIHAGFSPEQRMTQWEALVEIHESGKARAIGVSNFHHDHIAQLITAGLPAPHADQVELHPWSQKPELVAYLNATGIVPIAYSSLVPLSTWRAATEHRNGKTAQMRAASEQPESPFKVMAAKYGVSEAQLLLRWGIQNGFPVLPKSTNPHRVRQNADVFGFNIDHADMEAIKAMDRGQGVAWAVDPTTTK